MKCIVLLFFLSMLSLNMALLGDPRREERRMDERRVMDRRTDKFGTSGFGSKDRRSSSRDDRGSPFGMNRMRDGRRSDMEFPRISSKKGANNRQRSTSRDKSLDYERLKYIPITEEQRANSVGGYAKVGEKYIDIELNDKLRQKDLSHSKEMMGLGKKGKSGHRGKR